MEHDERAEQMEREAVKMEQESERVEGRIDETRSDWESKQQDQTIPGAQPDVEDELRQEIEAEEDDSKQDDDAPEEDDSEDEEEDE